MVSLKKYDDLVRNLGVTCDKMNKKNESPPNETYGKPKPIPKPEMNFITYSMKIENYRE